MILSQESRYGLACGFTASERTQKLTLLHFVSFAKKRAREKERKKERERGWVDLVGVNARGLNCTFANPVSKRPKRLNCRQQDHRRSCGFVTLDYRKFIQASSTAALPLRCSGSVSAD